MNIEVVEMIVNEGFDDCEVRENYKIDGGEVIGYCLKNNEYKFICVNNICVVVKKDFIYDMKVIGICKNDDELRYCLNFIK